MNWYKYTKKTSCSAACKEAFLFSSSFPYLPLLFLISPFPFSSLFLFFAPSRFLFLLLFYLHFHRLPLPLVLLYNTSISKKEVKDSYAKFDLN